MYKDSKGPRFVAVSSTGSKGPRMVNQASLRFIRFCIQYSSIAWLYYDYSLTWTREVRYIWLARFRYTTILYAFCRYALIANVIYLLALSNNVTRPDQAILACKALAVLARLAIVSIWTIRTWAIWHDPHPPIWILVLLCPLGVMCVICDIVAMTRFATPELDIATALGTCIHEWLATLLTTWRCLRALKSPEMIALPKGGLHQQIMDQGLIYFFGVSALSIPAIVLSYHRPTTHDGILAGRLLNAYVLPVSGCFTARFILQMRKLAERAKTGHHQKSFTVSTFGTVSGMEFRDYGPWDDERADES